MTCPNGCDLEEFGGTHQGPPDCDLEPSNPDHRGMTRRRHPTGTGQPICYIHGGLKI